MFINVLAKPPPPPPFSSPPCFLYVVCAMLSSLLAPNSIYRTVVMNIDSSHCFFQQLFWLENLENYLFGPTNL